VYYDDPLDGGTFYHKTCITSCKKT